MTWVPHVFANELKKAFSYRLNFWVQFLFGTATELLVAYFLWRAIFRDTGSTTMQGFSFTGLMYYYLFANFSGKITRGNDRGYISQDIYDGGLTRYLLYPVSFLGYKYVTHLTQQVLGVFQLMIALVFLRLALGDFGEIGLTPLTFLAGCLTCFLAGYLQFAIMSCLEMVSFWQDVTWNLMVMLRFAMSLLGGSLVPLAFYPGWARHLVSFTPFPLLISLPARIFLGQATAQEWLFGLALGIAWSALFTWVAGEIWRRGTRQYSGVGI